MVSFLSGPEVCSVTANPLIGFQDDKYWTGPGTSGNDKIPGSQDTGL